MGSPTDADKLMAEMARKYGIAAPTAASASAPRDDAVTRRSLEPPPGTPQSGGRQPPAPVGDTIADRLQNRKRELDKVTNYAEGGKIEGPGTPTSDSIRATVRQTGAPIRVSTGERIVSRAQGAYLERLATQMGFSSLDALLEHGQMRAASGAAPDALDPDNLEKMRRGIAAANIANEPSVSGKTLALAQPSTLNAASGAAVEQISRDRGALLRGVGRVADVLSLPGRAISDAVMGTVNVGGRALNAVAGHPLVKTDNAIGLAKYGLTPFYDAAAAAYPATPAANVPSNRLAPTPATTSSPPAAASPVAVTPLADSLALRQGAYIKANRLKDFRDLGGGIVVQRDTSGRLLASNVGTQDITDPGKFLYADAAGKPTNEWGKTAQYQQGLSDAANIRQQLGNIRRLRLEQQASGAEYNPRDAQEARANLAQMEQGEVLRQAGLGAVVQQQAGQIKVEQALRDAEMERLFLDPMTPDDQRKLARDYLLATRGKGDKTPEWKIGEYVTPDGVKRSIMSNGAQSFFMDEQAAQQAARQKPTFESYSQAYLAKRPGTKPEKIQSDYAQLYGAR